MSPTHTAVMSPTSPGVGLGDDPGSEAPSSRTLIPTSVGTVIPGTPLIGQATYSPSSDTSPVPAAADTAPSAFMAAVAVGGQLQKRLLAGEAADRRASASAANPASDAVAGIPPMPTRATPAPTAAAAAMPAAADTPVPTAADTGVAAEVLAAADTPVPTRPTPVPAAADTGVPATVLAAADTAAGSGAAAMPAAADTPVPAAAPTTPTYRMPSYADVVKTYAARSGGGMVPVDLESSEDEMPEPPLQDPKTLNHSYVLYYYIYIVYH
jgi:hypothetical protein